MLSLNQFIHGINQSTYKLDAIGVVGLFGGDRAADALETIHLYPGRRWVGWYNYPGGITVAMKFGQMADSRFWDTIFPGPNRSAAVTFNLAGKPGPDYSRAFSGTKLRTGYLGYLMTEMCADSPCKPLRVFKKDGSRGRETGSPAVLTITSFSPRQHKKIALNSSTTNTRVTDIPIEPKSDHPVALWTILPSLVSILACVFCFLGHDPLCASLILFGILSNGFSIFVLGSATLKICVPVSWVASPAGDGLMFPADGSIIVLRGKEADVSIITKGEFELDYPIWVHSHGRYHTIGISSLLLVVQVLVQFLLLPRCTFFGQILALVSFLTSGVYHLYVVSVSPDREKVHRDLLFRELSVKMEKWTLGTRAQMAVFASLVLGDGLPDPLESNADAVLYRIIPNEAAKWRYWRRKVVKELERFWRWDGQLRHLYVPSIQVEPEDQTDIDEYKHFTIQDKRHLDDLIDDAWCVFSEYLKWRNGRNGRKRGDRTKTCRNPAWFYERHYHTSLPEEKVPVYIGISVSSDEQT